MADHIQIPILDQTPPTEARKDEIEDVKKMDHSIVDIMKTNGQIYERLKSTTIFKVNVGLRESSPAAYIPKLISIGPYHNKSPKLRSMKKYKQLYLQRFLERNGGIYTESCSRELESCSRELEKLKDKALMCYDIENLDRDIVGKFSEIMLLDGCFLVEFIRERFEVLTRGVHYQPVIDKDWMMFQVCRDMVVLENQLPFFVLTMLHDMTKRPHEESFLYMVACTLRNVSPKKTCIPKLEIDRLDAKQVDHLLHVVHMVSCPSKKSITTKRSKERLDNLTSEQYLHFSSVTELHEAGVSFKKIGEKKPDYTDEITLLDIKFDKGLLEIPYFAVESTSETFLRNLIAFEQHSYNVTPYFSNYAHIMDQLISSPKDVQLLRESGIILNDIGDDKAVAKFFNKLGDGMTADPNDFYYYKEECSKLIQHCQKPWNKLRAILRHNYFPNPWAGASTVAAIVLLILTAMQTILAFTDGVK